MWNRIIPTISQIAIQYSYMKKTSAIDNLLFYEQSKY